MLVLNTRHLDCRGDGGFPKFAVLVLVCPYKKVSSSFGSTLGSPISGNYQLLSFEGCRINNLSKCGITLETIILEEPNRKP